MLSKSNTVNNKRNKIRKGAGAVSKKNNKKKSSKPNPESSQTDEFSYSGGEYIVSEASDNVYDNDSNEEDQDGDIDYFEVGAHYKNPSLLMLKINHVPTVGLL